MFAVLHRPMLDVVVAVGWNTYHASAPTKKLFAGSWDPLSRLSIGFFPRLRVNPNARTTNTPIASSFLLGIITSYPSEILLCVEEMSCLIFFFETGIDVN